MDEPLNEKGHDPKLVAALRRLVKRLEATPEPLRGPFVVKGLAPYLRNAPALPAPDGELVERLTQERDEARGKLALILDRIVYADSYGVPGSDFACCHLCNGGGAPGIPFEHDATCPVRTLEQDYENWFDDIRATEEALRETEARLSAVAAGALKPFADAAEHIEKDSFPDDFPVHAAKGADGLHIYRLTASDFRRAREALTTITGGENER